MYKHDILIQFSGTLFVPLSIVVIFSNTFAPLRAHNCNYVHRENALLYDYYDAVQ